MSLVSNEDEEKERDSILNVGLVFRMTILTVIKLVVTAIGMSLLFSGLLLTFVTRVTTWLVFKRTKARSVSSDKER